MEGPREYKKCSKVEQKSLTNVKPYPMLMLYPT